MITISGLTLVSLCLACVSLGFALANLIAGRR